MVSKKTDHIDGDSQKNWMNQSGERKSGSASKSENRRHVRFKAPDSTFVALNNGQTVVGRVRDISLGGLAFEYIKDAYIALSAAGHIDLFMSEKSFYLTGLRSRVVYEMDVPKDPKFKMFSSIDMCKCGIRFGEMKEDQIADLVKFIQIHSLEA